MTSSMTDDERSAILERCDKSMFVRVKDEHIEAGKSDNGGWTEDQLKLLGVDWPPKQGWKWGVVGRRIPGSILGAFIRLRGVIHISS